MDLMSTAQLLGNFGEFLGSVVVIVTLVYLAVQIRTARSEVDANSFNTTSNHLNSVDTAFLENAQIWTKAVSGNDLTPNEEFTFNTLTDMRANHAFFSYRRSKALENRREEIHAINLAAFFWEFPIAYQRWLEREKGRISLREVAGWPLKGDFVESVERAAELMEANPRQVTISPADN
jgi:hypothetical protein